MKKQIEIKNQQIDYELRVSNRAKRMRLAVYCDGSLVVTVPEGLGIITTEGFIKKKASWILDKLTHFRKLKRSLRFYSDTDHYARFKQKAQRVIKAKVEQYSNQYGFKVEAVNIKNQKTRWGSCSKKGSLNFNYKVLFLPEEIIDYIVVHELCHLKVFNHSLKFWDLVEEILPNYQSIRAKLKNQGSIL